MKTIQEYLYDTSDHYAKRNARLIPTLIVWSCTTCPIFASSNMIKSLERYVTFANNRSKTTCKTIKLTGNLSTVPLCNFFSHSSIVKTARFVFFEDYNRTVDFITIQPPRKFAYSFIYSNGSPNRLICIFTHIFHSLVNDHTNKNYHCIFKCRSICEPNQ